MNKWIDWFSSGQNTQAARLTRASGNTNTFIARAFYNASHGSIGGTPGYNDGQEGADYDYVIDRKNSILADQIMRAGLLAEGIDIVLIDDDEYGFPLVNPDVIE